METFAFVVKLNLLGTFSVSAKCAAQMAKQEPGEDARNWIRESSCSNTATP